MKKLTILFMLVAISIVNKGFAQATNWERAAFSGCYYSTSPGSSFTWSGDCYQGYCNGYGTIQWYDENGNADAKYVGSVRNGKNSGYGTHYYGNGYKYYEGYWQNDMKNGNGTTWYEDGSVQFSGYFINDRLRGMDEIESIASNAGYKIMNNVFDGGTNLSTEVLRYTSNEMIISITFYGDVVTTNYYSMKLLVRNYGSSNPYVDLYDLNSTAQNYRSFWNSFKEQFWRSFAEALLASNTH